MRQAFFNSKGLFMAKRGRPPTFKPPAPTQRVGRPTGFNTAALYDKLAIVKAWRELLSNNPDMPHQIAREQIAENLCVGTGKIRKAVTDYNNWLRLGYRFTELEGGGWFIQSQNDIERGGDPFENSKTLRKTSLRNIELI